MAKFEDNKQIEDLSSAIDAINKGERPALADPESQQLAEVALRLKHSGPPPAIIDNITGGFKKEAVAAKQKRRRWLFSGAAGIVAASLLVFALSLQPQPVPPEAPLALPPAGGIVIESLPDNSLQAKQSATPSQAVPPAAPRASGGQPAAGAVVNGINSSAATEKPVAEKMAPAAEPRAVSLALAGRKPDRVTVDKNAGVVRKVYGIGGREVTVTQKSVDTAKASSPNSGYMLMAAPETADRKTVAKSRQVQSGDKINKITRMVNGKEVTIEGEQSEEDLGKIADELVEEDNTKDTE